MARTKQTARRGVGGRAPQLATPIHYSHYGESPSIDDRRPHQKKPLFPTLPPSIIIKTAKQIPELDHHLVFGYIHCLEKNLSLQSVPSLIIYICLAFYYQKEYFMQSCDDIKVSNNKQTITKTQNDRSFNNKSYLNQWIESNCSQIVKWIFKINHIRAAIRHTITRPNNHYDPPRFVSFSLMSNNHCMNGRYPKPCYMIKTEGRFGGTISILKTGNSVFNVRIKPSVYWDKYDWISIILNTKNGTISVAKNDESPIVIVKNLEQGNDIKYRMCVSLCNIDDSVSLEYFSCHK